MTPERLNKAKRKAAGYVCLTLFHMVSSAVVHPLHQVAGINPNFDSDLGHGLTPKERDYVKKLASRLHDEAEILRRLGLRFLDRT